MGGAAGARNRAQSTSGRMGNAHIGVDSMRQFNYFGSGPGVQQQYQGGDSEDVEILEREINNVIMRKGGTAVGGRRHRDNTIINMTTGNNFNKDCRQV